MLSLRISSSVPLLKINVLSRTIGKCIRETSKLSCRLFSKLPRDVAGTNSLVKAVIFNDNLRVHWQDGDAQFHHLWLRHHCPCPACMDPNTKQRTIDMATIPEDVRPKQVDVASDTLRLTWEDGHDTCYHGSWLKENAYDSYSRGEAKKGYGSIVHESEMTLWNKDIITANPPPEFNYEELQDNGNLVRESLDGLFRYGFIFVNETPTDEESVAKVSQLIGGVVHETVFGRVSVLENKEELTHFDTSYLGGALDSHTDQTYFSASAGIQTMHCSCHDGTGGMSRLVDGFMAAKILFREDPEAFEVLTSTHVPFEYNSDYLRAHVQNPILELHPFTKELKNLRYNLTRLGPLVDMDLTYEEMKKFYQAVRSFGSILRRSENELWFKLIPGKVVVIDNRRLLHGRSAITGYRKLMTCYVTIDDYIG